MSTYPQIRMKDIQRVYDELDLIAINPATVKGNNTIQLAIGMVALLPPNWDEPLDIQLDVALESKYQEMRPILAEVIRQAVCPPLDSGEERAQRTGIGSYKVAICEPIVGHKKITLRPPTTREVFENMEYRGKGDKFMLSQLSGVPVAKLDNLKLCCFNEMNTAMGNFLRPLPAPSEQPSC